MYDLFTKPTPPPLTTPVYVGWLRVGRQPWRPLNEHETAVEAWNELHIEAAKHPHTELIVLPSGEKPRA